MKKYYNNGIAAKGHGGHEDGDSMLWAGLLLASGEILQLNAIKNCQDDSGKMYRSPRLREIGPAKNSFSRDMATGLTLAAASYPPLARSSYTKWIQYTLNNRCQACEEHDGRCLMTPGIYWWAHAMGIKVPWYYRITSFINRIYLFIACYVNPPGYQLHLAGVSLLIQKKLGQWGWREKIAAAKLAKRQPENAFFQWLAGNNTKARWLLDEAKNIIAQDGQGRMHQWGWERADEEQAWRDSCGHDIVFIENLLGK